ncbi:MAG: SH3 domain-containing protein [Cyanobacteria bacterium P01_C01_bin.120]
MVWISWNAGRYGFAIASMMVLVAACQPAAETPAPSDNGEATEETAPETVNETETTSEPTSASPAPTAPNSNSGANSTPTAAATPAQSCAVSAYVVDTDPAGLNVRSGPGSDFAVQGTLPTDVPVEVSIVGATDGWFLVNEAYSLERQELEQPGWVYGPLLGVSTTSLNINDPEAPTTLYAAPDGSAAVAATIPKYSDVTLFDCAGDWLQVDHAAATGWLAIGEQCSNPVSTCP